LWELGVSPRLRGEEEKSMKSRLMVQEKRQGVNMQRAIYDRYAIYRLFGGIKVN